MKGSDSSSQGQKLSARITGLAQTAIPDDLALSASNVDALSDGGLIQRVQSRKSNGLPVRALGFMLAI
jgi:hypothetical protein